MSKALDKKGSTQLSVRVPNPWLKDIEALVTKRSQGGLVLNRVDVLRMALRRGLDEMKAER
jgi:hypothetical protein